MKKVRHCANLTITAFSCICCASLIKLPDSFPVELSTKNAFFFFTPKGQTTHTSCNGGSSAVKKVQKTTNYASVECGAKILASNPEAKVLKPACCAVLTHFH